MLDIHPQDRGYRGRHHRVSGDAARVLLSQSATKDSQVCQQINKDKETISQGLRIRLISPSLLPPLLLASLLGDRETKG